LELIKDYEAGIKVTEIFRNTFYKCKEKYEESGIKGFAPKVISNVTRKEFELRRENKE